MIMMIILRLDRDNRDVQMKDLFSLFKRRRSTSHEMTFGRARPPG